MAQLEGDGYYSKVVSQGIVVPRDGGNWFWRVLLNVSDGTVLSAMVNGEA